MVGLSYYFQTMVEVLGLHLTIIQWEREEGPSYCPVGVEVLGRQLVSTDTMRGSELLTTQASMEVPAL